LRLDSTAPQNDDDSRVDLTHPGASSTLKGESGQVVTGRRCMLRRLAVKPGTPLA